MSVHPQARRPVTFRPNPGIKKRLDNLSQQTNRPVSFYINAILEEHLDDLEYAYLLKARQKIFVLAVLSPIPWIALRKN